MNVFVLDMDLQKCAEYHTDKHIVKMITETAQLLSSAYYSTEEANVAPYKLSHKNHPWAIWARTSKQNWDWLKQLGMCLYEEYKYRYHKSHHRGGDMIIYMSRFPPSLPDGDITAMPLCMPSDCKTDDVVESYRNYYLSYKTHIFMWTGRSVPYWIKQRRILMSINDYREELEKLDGKTLKRENEQGLVLLSVALSPANDCVLLTKMAAIDGMYTMGDVYSYNETAGKVTGTWHNNQPMTEYDLTVFEDILMDVLTDETATTE